MALKIAADKKKHFLVGIPLGVLLQFLSSRLFPFQPVLSGVVCIVALVAICHGFELVSLVTGKGHYDKMDTLAGVLGGLLGMAVFWGWVFM